jgi:hypothetical protein
MQLDSSLTLKNNAVTPITVRVTPATESLKSKKLREISDNGIYKVAFLPKIATYPTKFPINGIVTLMTFPMILFIVSLVAIMIMIFRRNLQKKCQGDGSIDIQQKNGK